LVKNLLFVHSKSTIAPRA